MRLYLNVPYSEKDAAKALGARWNPRIKKWYADTSREQYIKFAKWILRDTDDAIIAIDHIFVIEGRQPCWKCHRSTRVIGLGVSEHIHIFDAGDGPQYEGVEDGTDKELHLAWVGREECVPPILRKYLMEKYSVKTGYSKTLQGKCFANHCDYCGTLQGNWFLFNEPDSPLMLMSYDGGLAEQAGKLKIFRVPISDDLQLDWDVGYGSTDYAYFKYGQCEELVLSSDLQNKSASYEDLYGAGGNLPHERHSGEHKGRISKKE